MGNTSSNSGFSIVMLVFGGVCLVSYYICMVAGRTILWLLETYRKEKPNIVINSSSIGSSTSTFIVYLRACYLRVFKRVCNFCSNTATSGPDKLNKKIEKIEKHM